MRVWRLLMWFVVVDALITIFGVMTAPLLLILAADSIVAILIIYNRQDLGLPTLAEPNGND